jgi:hypothetical protein
MGYRSWKEFIDQLGGLTPTPEGEFVPVPEAELTAIEAKCGAKLPDDYREFLATYGSATFARLVSIRSAGPLPQALSDDGMLPFDAFYGTVRLADRCPGVLSCIDNFHGEIPDGLLPIANGWQDDQICIGMAGEQHGRVYYYDSQNLDADEVSTRFPYTYYIADSFTDLLNQMRPSTDDEVA